MVKDDISDIKKIVHKFHSDCSQSSSPSLDSNLITGKTNKKQDDVNKPTIAEVLKTSLSRIESSKSDSINQTGNSKKLLNPLAKSFPFHHTKHQRTKYDTRQGIFGTKSNCKFAGAPRLFDVYIGRCNMDTRSDNIIEHCEEAGIKPIKCDTLPTKSEYYCSFKLTVNASSRESLMTPDFWPDGIVARKFYSPRSAKQNTIDPPTSPQ